MLLLFDRQVSDVISYCLIDNRIDVIENKIETIESFQPCLINTDGFRQKLISVLCYFKIQRLFDFFFFPSFSYSI